MNDYNQDKITQQSPLRRINEGKKFLIFYNLKDKLT